MGEWFATHKPTDYAFEVVFGVFLFLVVLIAWCLVDWLWGWVVAWWKANRRD